MSDLRDLLHGAASAPSDDFDFDAVMRRTTRRRRRRHTLVATLMTAAVVIPILFAMSIRNSSEPTGPVETPPVSVDATVSTTTPSSTTQVPAPSTTTVPEVPAGFRTVAFAVVDENGRPHDESVGVSVCDTSNRDACAWPGLDDFDGDGIVTATVKLDADYEIQGFVRDADWPGAFIGPDGAGYVTSSAFQARGDELGDSTTITIPVPVRVEFVVLDGAGNPLPPGIGGVMACRADGTGACTGPIEEYRVVDDVDGDGTVTLGLDPGLSWSVTGIARGAGWCDPWTDNPEGVEWHFGTRLVGTASELNDRELRVVDPCA